MWPAMDLGNRGVFMELGKSETNWGVPGTEGACNTPNYTLTVL